MTNMKDFQSPPSGLGLNIPHSSALVSTDSKAAVDKAFVESFNLSRFQFTNDGHTVIPPTTDYRGETNVSKNIWNLRAEKWVQHLQEKGYQAQLAASTSGYTNIRVWMPWRAKALDGK